MDIERLHSILTRTTVILKKYEGVNLLEMYSDEFALVDCHFFFVCVDKNLAQSYQLEFVDILAEYPKPDHLAKSPSYIEIGRELRSEELAFQFFAFGQALGMWQVETPATMGIAPGHVADDLARGGEIRISSYKNKKVACSA